MQPTPANRSPQKRFITSKTVFTVTIIVGILTVLSIWLFGLGSHRTLFANSLVSTTILAAAFFLFLTINLYQGVKLKDDLGRITNNIKLDKLPDIGSNISLPDDVPDAGEGCGAVIVGIITWILVSFLILFLVWASGTLLWAMVLVFAAMLYWVFFRAVRLVFKNANRCKGNLSKSAAYGFGYTILYSGWIYGIILAAHYLVP